VANFFINSRSILQDADTPIYSCPAARTAIVIGLQVANVTGSTEELDLWWTDASAANAVTYLSDGIQIPTQSAFGPIIGKLVLEGSDALRGLALNNNALEVTVSVLEIE
jgi:hypothetical protein